MSHATGAPERAPTVYALPEAAHFELVHLRDHLGMMSKLSALKSNASTVEARLRDDALAWWFARLEKDLAGIVAASTFSMQLAKAYDASRVARKTRATGRRKRKSNK
ncbi:XAC0095 family protein [Lysobacter sp. 2RAF19]